MKRNLNHRIEGVDKFYQEYCVRKLYLILNHVELKDVEIYLQALRRRMPLERRPAELQLRWRISEPSCVLAGGYYFGSVPDCTTNDGGMGWMLAKHPVDIARLAGRHWGSPEPTWSGRVIGPNARINIVIILLFCVVIIHRRFQRILMVYLICRPTTLAADRRSPCPGTCCSTYTKKGLSLPKKSLGIY